MDWKKFLVEGIVGATFYTIVLTPYMVLVTHMTLDQYISWIFMEYILITPLMPISMVVVSKIRDWILRRE